MNKTIEYLIGDMITDIIECNIFRFYRGKVSFVGPDPERVITIHSGIAGYKQIKECIQQMMINSGLVITASEIRALEPINYVSWTVPFLANMKFYHDDEFDKQEPTQYVDGYPIESYNYRITDDTTGERLDIVATGVREPRGPVKYYWVLIGNDDRITWKQEVCTIHPFILYPDYLINWREVTKE